MEVVIITALCIGLVQMLKKTFKIPSRYIPFTTLLVTFVLVALYVFIEGRMVTWMIVQNSIIIALSAMGLWSGTKAVTGN